VLLKLLFELVLEVRNGFVIPEEVFEGLLVVLVVLLVLNVVLRINGLLELFNVLLVNVEVPEFPVLRLFLIKNGFVFVVVLVFSMLLVVLFV